MRTRWGVLLPLIWETPYFRTSNLEVVEVECVVRLFCVHLLHTRDRQLFPVFCLVPFRASFLLGCLLALLLKASFWCTRSIILLVCHQHPCWFCWCRIGGRP